MSETHWRDLRDGNVEEMFRARREIARLKPLTRNQAVYFNAVREHTVTLCSGPAGTGKTYMACGLAADELKDGKVDRIVLARPMLECDEEMGFLPGTAEEKFGPWTVPMIEAFSDFFTPQDLKDHMAKQRIQIVPLAHMRGRTFHDAFCILDEAQNTTKRQMLNFLTRFGGNKSRVVVCGDHTQSDLPPNSGINTLVYAIEKLWDEPEIAIVHLTEKDIVRHGLIQRIIRRWSS